MPWNGSGTFNRIYSWVADKAAGLDISSTRMDADTNDITSQGFGNCLTRDGQGGPSANLPMNNFKHTGLGNGSARTDSPTMGQVQDGLLYWTIDSGSATAYACTYTPALTALNDGQLCYFRAANANTTTTPTFSPNGLTARTITRLGGSALVAGDIQANQEVQLRYNSGSTRWEILNPSLNSVIQTAATTGDVKLTLKTSADSGWLLFDDGTFGSATSGSSNSNNANNQSLFVLMFNNLSDSAAPLFTSGGAGTTRAAQGTAAAAWAANCRMSLPKTLGRALAVAGTGSGLTARALGSIVGQETVTLNSAHIPSLTSTNASQSITVTPPASAVLPTAASGDTWTAVAGSNGSGNNWVRPTSNVGVGTATSLSGSNSISTTYTNASPSAFTIMQPETFFNAMIKQ